MQRTKVLKRGAYKRQHCVFIGAWFPSHWVVAIDELVKTEDTDRSKFFRRAVKAKLGGGA